ncbi:MAG: recombinase family protein [Promethearchaeota archaeon]
MKKASIYARVSTERQEEQKTIDSQIFELRQACKKDGVEIVKEYTDDGFSGGILARPGLDQLRDDVSRDLFNTVYILSPDRLARKYLYQALVIEELKKKDIEVIFLNKPVTDSPEDQLLLGIEGLIAEYERAKILERTRRGRLHRARNGEIMGGSAPYGYDYLAKTKQRAAYYKVNEKESEVVRLIFSLYLRFRSTSKIVKVLANKKIRTRNNSKYWSKGSIHRILTNECYLGTAYYNKHDRGGGKLRIRERSEWIPIKIPKIVNDDTFELVQKVLKSHGGGKRRRIYILSGLMRCDRCGSKYIGLSSNKGRHFYYRCGNLVRRFPLPKNCDSRPVKAERIESAVLNAIKNALLRPQILINHVMGLAKNILEKGKNAKKDKERLMNKKKNLDDKKARLLELYLEKIIQKSAYLEKRKEIEEKEKELEKRKEDVSHVAPYIDKSLIIQNVKYFSELAKKRIRNLEPQELQEFLAYLIDEITFDSNEMKVKRSCQILFAISPSQTPQNAFASAKSSWPSSARISFSRLI